MRKINLLRKKKGSIKRGRSLEKKKRAQNLKKDHHRKWDCHLKEVRLTLYEVVAIGELGDCRTGNFIGCIL